MSNVKALISGSFDPISKGHESLISKASEMFGTVYVTIFVNSEKNPMFSVSQRLEMLKLVCGKYKNVITDSSDGLVADYADKNGISVIVRGIRNASDTDYELSLAEVNRTLSPKLKTILIPSEPELSAVSSTVIREMIRYRKSISKYVPHEVGNYINSINIFNCR